MGNFMDLIKEFNEFIERNQIELNNKKVLVGVSGGIDSMVLLTILEKLQDKYNFKIVVGHVNHKKRQESEIEEEYIKSYCENKHKLCVLHFDDSDKVANSFQEYARNKRLSFFFECMDKEGCDYLFLAHHLNDDIETFFMHLIRSSSIESITGIKEVNNYKNHIILRPFLRVLKKDLYEYGKDNDVKYFEDKSNLEDDYTRNRIRHKIVEALFEENKAFGDAFLDYKKKMIVASSIISEIRDQFIEDNISVNDDYFSFSKDKFNNCDDVLKEEILFYLLKRYQYSKAFIDELIKDISSDKRSFVINYKDISLIKDKDNIRINHYLYEANDTYLEIKDFGRYQLNDEYDIIFEKVDNVEKKDVLSIPSLDIIWYNTDMFPFYIRSRKDGDVILLSSGHKKIKDLLIDLHLSKTEKDKTLLLLDKDEDVLAVLGIKKSACLSKCEKLNLKIELRRKQ